MRVLPACVIPIFLGRTTCWPVAAQLSFFDVYYRTPPVVGFQVMGCEPDEEGLAGFTVMYDAPAEPPIGFEVSEQRPQDHMAGFVVLGDDTIETPIGFEAHEDIPDSAPAGFTATEEGPLESPFGLDVQTDSPDEALAGFFVEEKK